jgi:hypothetical protein
MKIFKGIVGILSLVAILIMPSLAYANMGAIVMPGMGEVKAKVSETGQNAIVAWDGSEEVLMLSRDMKGSAETSVLEMMPLPANPDSVEEGSNDSFERLVAIYNSKIPKVPKTQSVPMATGLGEGSMQTGVDITFYQKIGAHEVTVVRVESPKEFLEWVSNFAVNHQLQYSEPSAAFYLTVLDYLGRGIRYFVFDFIDVSTEIQTIKPLIYSFASSNLYYPLEITATSDLSVAQSATEINLFLVTDGSIKSTSLRSTRLGSRGGYFSGADYRVNYLTSVKFTARELNRVDSRIAELFPDGARVTNLYYSGAIDELNKDLSISKDDIDPNVIPATNRYANYQVWGTIIAGVVITFVLIKAREDIERRSV